MGKRLLLASYLTMEQVVERYRHESDGVTRIPWHIRWHKAAGKTTQEMAAITGLTLRRNERRTA